MPKNLPTETEAMKRVIKVAKEGDWSCQMQLAETYMLGAVCKKDLHKATYWLTQATLNYAQTKGKTKFAKKVSAAYDKYLAAGE